MKHIKSLRWLLPVFMVGLMAACNQTPGFFPESTPEPVPESAVENTSDPELGAAEPQAGVYPAKVCGGITFPGINKFYPCCENGGNCTFYAASKMVAQWGSWIMDKSLGNASLWDTNAKNYKKTQGGNWSKLTIDTTPQVGSVAVMSFGHVAWVEGLIKDQFGKITKIKVSEMNCDPTLKKPGGVQPAEYAIEKVRSFISFPQSKPKLETSVVPTTAQMNDQVRFVFKVTNPAGQTTKSLEVNLGDGSPVKSVLVPNDGIVTVQHVFSKAATYQWSATAYTDQKIPSNTIQGSITIQRSAVQSTKVSLKSNHSGLCVDIPGSNTKSGLIQWNCHGGQNQIFNLEPIQANSDRYLLKLALDPQKCIAGASKDAIVENCQPSKPSHQWTLKGNVNETSFINAASNLCLDLYGPSNSPGAKIGLWTCKTSGDTRNQQFQRISR